MRRWGSWGVTAALVVGLGAVAAAKAADDDSRSAPAKNWWSGWFAEKPQPKAKKSVEKKAADDDRPAPLPKSAETAVLEQQKQMKAYLRRTEVCMRLRQIAEQTGNADLMRQADALDVRAWEVYRQQTDRLPVPASTLDEATRSDQKKPASRKTIAAKASAGVDDDVALPAANTMPPRRGPNSLGGAFDQRERDLINGTFMGRDRP